MIVATRFRTVVWVAGVATAALGCYLVSLRVAAERAEVAKLDRSLIAAQEDMRQLGTELGTRSRLVQLERWNADVLALTAPKAGQYLAGEMQLASLVAPPASAPEVPSAAAAALQPTPAIARVAYTKVVDRPASRLLHSVSLSLDDAGHDAFRPVTLAYLGKPGRP